MRSSKSWSLGLLGLLAVLPIAGLAQPDSSAPLEHAPAPAVASEPVHFSPGVRDVLKLLDAKVEPSVINSYIKSSTVAYNPTATEIIALKEHGVSDDIIMALLQRGAEVRTQLAHSVQTAPSGAPNSVQPPYSPDYMQSAPDSYPAAADYGSTYSYGYPYYSYPYYGYSGYPYYWNTWYPWAWWPYYYRGYYAHNHYYHGNYVNHFHTGHAGSFAHAGVAHAGVAHTGFAHATVAHAGFGGGAVMHGGGGFSGGHGGGGGGGHGGGGHR